MLKRRDASIICIEMYIFREVENGLKRDMRFEV